MAGDLASHVWIVSFSALVAVSRGFPIGRTHTVCDWLAPTNLPDTSSIARPSSQQTETGDLYSGHSFNHAVVA
jgi:hypothetical protein